MVFNEIQATRNLVVSYTNRSNGSTPRESSFFGNNLLEMWVFAPGASFSSWSVVRNVLFSARHRGILRPMSRKLLSDFVQLQTAVRIALVLVASAPATVFGQGTALVSPELHKDGSVTFRLERPGAHEVLVALAGLETPLKMTQAQGIWSATTAPLESGAYWYSYLVDGKAELDPLNADVIPNYTYLNSVVRVPGPGGEPWERTDVPHGELHRHFYESKIAKGLPDGRSEYFLYTPPGYESHASTQYPTLYLLHGLSQGATDWTAMGGANFVLDSLIAQGKAKPMVVVMPLGYGDLAVAGKTPSDAGFGRAVYCQ